MPDVSPETTPTGGPRPNRNTLWLIGVIAAVVVIGLLMFSSRAGDGRSGAQTYSDTGGTSPAAADAATRAARGGSGG